MHLPDETLRRAHRTGAAALNNGPGRTYCDVLAQFLAHPEAKSLDPDGEPVGRNTRGLLQRCPVEGILPVMRLGKTMKRGEVASKSGLHRRSIEGAVRFVCG